MSDTVDEYICLFPEEVQSKLTELRTAIMQAAPDAEEKISYKMPAYALNGILVYFAAYKHHIGFYPTGSGMNAFKNVLTGYRCSKGTVQFPLNEPLPLELIRRIVVFRVEENAKKRLEKKSH